MLVDTSILIRILEPHPDREAIRSAIKTLTEQGRALHIFPQNLVELWSVMTRPVEQNGLGMDVKTAALELQQIKSMFFVLPETAAIYPAWEQIVIENKVSGKAVHDARLVAAMQVHKLTSILSLDAGFTRYEGIELVRPRDVIHDTDEGENPPQ